MRQVHSQGAFAPTMAHGLLTFFQLRQIPEDLLAVLGGLNAGIDFGDVAVGVNDKRVTRGELLPDRKSVV